MRKAADDGTGYRRLLIWSMVFSIIVAWIFGVWIVWSPVMPGAEGLQRSLVIAPACIY